MKFSFVLWVFAVSLLSLSAKADLCALNEGDKQSVSSAIEILKQNYGADGPYKLYVASVNEMFPWLDGEAKGRFVEVSELTISENSGPYFHLVGKGYSYAIDLGWTYFLDKNTQQWTNLGRAVSCKGITGYNYIQYDIARGGIPLNLQPGQ